MSITNQYEFINKINQPLVFDTNDGNLLQEKLKIILEKINKTCELTGKVTENQHVYNVFGVVGERGSGKTSLMESLRNELKKQKYYVFDMIDPSIFDDSLSISELILSKMYLDLKRLSIENDYKIIHIYSKMKELIKLLGNIKIDRGTFIRENPNAEILTDASNRTNFHEEMRKLLHAYKSTIIQCDKEQKYCYNKPIIVCIDDIDITKNKVVYEMLEDIRKFFKDEIIVIISYRSKQLFASVNSEELYFNKELIDYKLVSMEEIINRTFNYLDKIIPYSNQISLLASQEILSISAGEYFNFFGMEKSTEESLEEYITERIYEKTRINIRPIDFRERTQYNFPRNLRGINQLVYLVEYELEELPSTENIKNDIENAGSVLIRNLVKYRDYINKGLQESLNSDQIDIIARWQEVSTPAKNYQIYASLVQKIKKDKKDAFEELKKDEILDIDHIQPFNIALADAREMMETYKTMNAYNESEVYLIYSIKKLYSIELLMAYLKGVQASSEKSGNNFETYLQLLNAHIISQNLLKNSDVSPDFTFSEEIDDDFIKNFVFVQQTARGDVVDSVRKKINSGNAASNRYRFHQYFYYNDDIKELLKNSRYYEWNPFAKLAKSQYVNESLCEENIKTIDKSPMPYIVYSLFDLDLLERINYARQSEDKPVEKFLNKLNYVMKANESDDKSNLKSEFGRLTKRIFGVELTKGSGEDFIEPSLKSKVTEYVKEFKEESRTKNSGKSKSNEDDNDNSTISDEIKEKIKSYEYDASEFKKAISNFKKEDGKGLISFLIDLSNNYEIDDKKKEDIIVSLNNIYEEINEPRMQFNADRQNKVTNIYEELRQYNTNNQPDDKDGEIK